LYAFSAFLAFGSRHDGKPTQHSVANSAGCNWAYMIGFSGTMCGGNCVQSPVVLILLVCVQRKRPACIVAIRNLLAFQLKPSDRPIEIVTECVTMFASGSRPWR
jgi:hypothetical protein